MKNNWKWYAVECNGGITAVHATSEEKALKYWAAGNMLLDIIPGVSAHEISENEAESYYYKIR